MNEPGINIPGDSPEVSPQLENGYIKIANEIWDVLCRTRIPGEERQIFDVIIRKTWGFNKKSDSIPLTQFETATGLTRNHVCRAIKNLENKRLISPKKGTGKVTTYCINKNYSQWSVVPKKGYPNIGSPHKENLPVPKKGHSKDILSTDSKDTLSPKNFSDLWNEIVKGNLSQVISLSDLRIKKINVRMKERSIDEWRTVFTKMSESDFCQGVNDRNWKADFDWIIENDNNAVKVLEGKYDNRIQAPPITDPPATVRNHSVTADLFHQIRSEVGQ